MFEAFITKYVIWILVIIFLVVTEIYYFISIKKDDRNWFTTKLDSIMLGLLVSGTCGLFMAAVYSLSETGLLWGLVIIGGITIFLGSNYIIYSILRTKVKSKRR